MLGAKAKSEPPLLILVVDDDPTIRRVITTFLRESGWKVDVAEAPSAQEAQHALAKRKFDCMVLDYLLPDVDGLHFLQELRDRGNHVSTVMLTGHGTGVLADKMKDLEVENYMDKAELTKARLLQLVGRAVGRSVVIPHDPPSKPKGPAAEKPKRPAPWPGPEP